MNREERAKRPITIFGAGVAGLTAAHELAMRGFTVQVIDKDYNEERNSETYDRGIGGMARSQWAVAANSTVAGAPTMRRLWSGRELLHDEAIRFKLEPNGAAVPKDPGRASAQLDAYKKAVDALVAAHVNAYTIAIVVPIDDAAKLELDPRIIYVRRELAARGVSQSVLDQVFAAGDPAADRTCVYFSPLGHTVAAEHGFRFFPSFYRHLFDTMRRITIQNPRPSERTKATVFENLVPSEGLGFARAGQAVSFMIPRSAIVSLERARRILCAVLGELEYTAEDIARFSLRLFKYMTASSRRRAAQYEDMSWGDFVGSTLYSEISRQHIEYGPQMSAALRGSASDSRTQGNILIQLLLDQLKPNALTDYLLAGPSTGAWFDHWHDFLRKQGVTFARGTLEDFEVRDGRVVPRVRGADVKGTNFILALSLPAIRAIADKFLVRAGQAGIPREKLRDFERVQAFAGSDLDADLALASPKGPLQHLSGIQYYFDQDVRFWRGHTQYLDSAWGLTSIAQAQFWARPRSPEDEYRSILSVDIGIFDREYRPASGGPAKAAWDCTVQEIADYAWEQIKAHHDDAFVKRYGKNAVFPEPIAFALDAYLTFDPRDGSKKTNESPFLVNKTGQYRSRPGRVVRAKDRSKNVSHYDVIPSGKGVEDSFYVLAGTFMQTFTRLTSMESANESARHAVNALMQVWRIGGDRCDIWDPEDHEIDDLEWFKELDEKLLERKLPHFVDILGWSELPEHIGPHDLAALGFANLIEKDKTDGIA